jgi:carbonic anhydrase/acetyltransferase-like protein (isoleucine patch superfamily)
MDSARLPISPLPDAPLLLAYQGVAPVLLAPLAGAGAGAAILGRVTLGARAVLGRFAVLRGDGHVIEVGDHFHLGAHSTVHIAHDLYGTTVGDRVAVGANAVVHACTVGDDCVIEDDVAVLDGSVVGAGSVVARGSVVFPRRQLPPGHWCAGVPAVPLRPVTAAELAELQARIRAPAEPAPAEAAAITLAPGADGYVAATVSGRGTLAMGAGSSLWFGCVVAGAGAGPAIEIAAGANVQDNSVLRASDRALVVGPESIVGHNVQLHDCTLGARVLVGMESVLAPGTVVQDDVLIAAGSTTTPGQVLEEGWLWGGRPARPLTLLSESKRALIRLSAAVYRDYATAFAAAEAETLGR